MINKWFITLCLIVSATPVKFLSRKQIFLAKESTMILSFHFQKPTSSISILASLRLENNWMARNLPFDIVVSQNKDDVKCLTKEACNSPLSLDTVSYSYVKKKTIDFTQRIKEYSEISQEFDIFVILINKKHMLAPKPMVDDLKLDTIYSFEIVKDKNNIWKNLAVTVFISMLLLTGVLYIKFKNMSKEVKIYDEVLQDLEIQFSLSNQHKLS